MNTYLSRLNSVFAFTLTTLACVTFLCFSTTAFSRHEAPAELKAEKVAVRHAPDYSTSRTKKDLGTMTFNCKTDIASLFNWNVKMLFLYLTAEYTTQDHKVNQVVLWDKIVMRGQNTQFDLQGSSSKYYFWDEGSGLRGNRNVTLTLSWNVIPNAGILPRVAATGSHRFSFPSEYISSRM